MLQKEIEIENPPASKGAEKPQCHIHDEVKNHIHDKVKNRQVDEIRQNVCVNDLPPTEFKGKHYCLFHLPTQKKDLDKFEQIFKDRLEAVERKFAVIEKLSEDKQAEAKSRLHYDFRYVWFPSEVNFGNHKFVAAANFRSATFSAAANFMSATFSAHASFNWATFSAHAYFNSATFSALVNFSSATFSAHAYFNSAIFSTYAYFRSAEFLASADFSSAKFEELSRIFFRQTKFSSALSFNYTNFKGYVEFKGGQDNRFFNGEKALLDLQNARIDDAKKISFYTIRFEPSWFINTNATEFVFTDCLWRYANGKRLDVKIELKNLKNREFENPNVLLTKTCWQLADNHEESKSFPEASLFRRIAFESERLGRKEKLKTWRKDIGKVFSDETECKNVFPTTVERAKRFGDLVKSPPFDFVHFLYHWLSGYGEKWFRAFCWLLFVWIFFALLYTFFGIFVTEKGQVEVGFWKSFGYSLQVMTLQRPEPRPYSAITYLFYGLETIFAPLQAALLALAIRRKVMR